MKKKTALVTGVTGQDGAYLSRLLLEQGYRVVGTCRQPQEPAWRLAELGLESQVERVALDLRDDARIQELIRQLRPDEVYNLAAQSFVGPSGEEALYTADVNALGPVRLLEAIRAEAPEARFYQASSSMLYGKVREVPQCETTPFHPLSPYATAKLYAHWMTANYRDHYGLYACSGILFNHESPLRGSRFVTRKITHGMAQLARGGQQPIELGNLNAQRDWGFAGDYVRGMWLMLQQNRPEDFVLATGQLHSVRDFVEAAAAAVGFEVEWQQPDESLEQAVDRSSGRVLVQVAQEQFRPGEVDLLQGDASKARQLLGWTPSVAFDELVTMMAQADLTRSNSPVVPA